MCVKEMLGGVFWKSWPDYVVSVKSDLTSGAALSAEPASSRSLSVLLREREAPSDSGQPDKSPGSGNIWTYAAIKVHLHLFLDSFRRRMVFGKVGDRITSWENLQRSMMPRLSEQVRWSLRLLLRPPHRRSIKRIYKAFPALRGVNDSIWWFNRDVALAL